VSLTPLYALRKFDDGESARTTAVIVNQHADTVEAALQTVGSVPPDLTAMLAQLAAFNTLNTAGAFTDSGWVAITNSGTIRTGYTPQVRKIGKLVIARGGWTTSGQTANTTAAVGTIPSGYRPSTGQATMEMQPGMSSAGSLGKILVTNSTGVVSTVVGGTPPGYMVLDGMSWTTD
jgi:hypothetical protein